MNIFSIFDFKSCLNDVDERYRQFDPKEGPFGLKFLSEELIQLYKKGFHLYSNIDVQHCVDKRAIDIFKKKMDEIKKTKESILDFSDLKRLIAECKELYEIPETKLVYTIEANLPKYIQISASLLLDTTWEKFPDDFKARKGEWLKHGKFAHYPTAGILEAFNQLKVLKNIFKVAHKEIRFKFEEIALEKVGPLLDQINPLFIPGAFLEKYCSHLENQLSLATKEKETLILAMLSRLKFMSENRKQSQFKLPSDDILADLIAKVKGCIQEDPWVNLPCRSHFSETSHENFYQVHYKILKQLDALAKDKDKNDSYNEIKKSFEALFWITGNDTCKIQLVQKDKKIIMLPKSHAFLAGKVDSSYYKGPHISDFALYQIQNEHLKECLQNKQYEKVSKLVHHISTFLIQQKRNANTKFPIPSTNKKLVEAWQRIFLEMTEKLIEKSSAWTEDCLKNLLSYETHDLTLYQFIKSLKFLALEFEKTTARNSAISSFLDKIIKTEKSLLQKKYIIKVDQSAEAYFYYFDKLNLVISASLQTSIDPILGMKKAEYPQALHQLEEAVSQIWKDKGLYAIILQRLLFVQLKACLKPNEDLFNLVHNFEMQSAFRDVNIMGHWVNTHTSKLNDLLAKFLKVHQYPLKELKEDLEILRLCEKYVPGNWKTLKEHLLKYIEDVDLEELEKIKAINSAKKKQLEHKLIQNHEKPDHLNQLMNLENREKNCAQLLVLLKDESLILAYGHKCLIYYENKNFSKIDEDDELAELCFLCSELRNAASQKLLAFCLKNIKEVFQYFSDWAQLNNYFTSEDSKTFSKEFSAIFFEKLDRQFSLKGDFGYLQKFLSFKFAFLPEDRVALEAKLKEFTQNDWNDHLGKALEFLYKYLDLKSLQSFRLKWFKGLATLLNRDPKIPKFYEPKNRGFDGLCSFYGVEFLHEVFESIKELYKQPEMSKNTYDLLGKYLDTKADSPEQSDESPLIQKMYLEYCTLADEINESLTSQIPVIGSVMEMMDEGNYKEAFEKIGQHCRQLPSRHVTRLTQHQVRAKQVMDILYDKIENWLIKKIRDKGFNINAFKEAFTAQKTPRLELLCEQTNAVVNLGNYIQKLAESYGKTAGDIHLALNKDFAYRSNLSQWYVFLINNNLFSLLNCLPHEDKSLLKETIQKIFMRTHDPLLKKACMILMPFLRDPYRLNKDIDLKNQEIVFLQALCGMFLRDSFGSMENLDPPMITRALGKDLKQIDLTFSKDELYQVSLPELKILSCFKQFAEGKGLTIPTEDLKNELQKLNRKSFAFPISSSYQKWDAVKNSVLGERYLHPGVQKKLFDENHKLIEEAKVKGHFKNTVAFAEINSDGFYFKFSPRGIGIQTMVSTLERILFGEGLPITLMKLDYNIDGKKEPCPVQISLGVKGETITEVWNKRKENFKVDLMNFSQNFVRILLDRELDGQPGNYIATLQQNSQFYSLRVIDSEQGFGKLEGKNSLQIVSLVLCLNEMKQPLHSDVVNHIISLDPYDIISQFIADIDIQTQQYLSLFDQKVRQHQFNQKEMAFLLPPLTREMVRDIFMTFCQLQDILKKKPNISHLEVLKKIHPSVAMSYEHVLEQEEKDPQARFEHVSEEQKRHVIVDKAEGRSYTSSLSNAEFYKTISPKKLASEKDLKEEIIKPSEALEYLSELNTLYAELESIQKDFLDDNVERFLKLEDSVLKEAVINGIEGRFKGISFEAIPIEKHEKILSYMEGMTFRSLRLKGCSETLTPQKLTSLLRSSPNLQLLDISGCKKIDDEAFQELMDLVEKVEVLILDDTDLTFVGGPYEFRPFLRYLQYISMKNCLKLRNVKIISPSLKKVYLDGSNYNNLIIRRFDEKDKSFKEIFKEFLAIPKIIFNEIIGKNEGEYPMILDELNYGEYPIGYEEIKKSRTLKELKISSEFHGENIEEHMENIKNILLQHRNTIRNIEFLNVNLSPEQIGDLIQNIPNLEAIALVGPVISNQTVKFVLEKQKKLMKLCLSKCPDVSKEYVIQLFNQSKHLSIYYFK